MNKQELARRIVRDMGYDYQTVRNIIDGIAFEGWLHDPDQVPGRTITVSEIDEACSTLNYDEVTGFKSALDVLGAIVVPDPEPTNAEKLKDLIWDEGHVTGRRAQAIAEHLDRLGVKVPGGDDDA